jgi:hypothetical protein
LGLPLAGYETCCIEVVPPGLRVPEPADQLKVADELAVPLYVRVVFAPTQTLEGLIENEDVGGAKTSIVWLAVLDKHPF